MPEVLSDESPGVAEAMHAAFNPVPKTPEAATAPTPAATPEAPPAETPGAPETTPTPAADGKLKTGFDSIEKEWTPELEAKLRKLYPEHKMWRVKDVVENKYKTQLEELKGRPETPANDNKIKELEQRLSEREKLIAERDGEVKTWKQRSEEVDYTRGEEYTSKYVQPYQTEMRRALDEVKRLNFKYVDTDGQPQTRQATEADFEKAMKLGASEQDEFLEAAFGKSAWRITNRINELERIRSASIQATQDFAANYEKNKVAKELETKRQRDDYEKALAEAHSGFQKDPELGKYLTEAETDPEGTKLFKSALEKFDSFKTVQPTAADAAEVRASYAMKPRLVHEVRQLSAKVASLESELAKFRGADPGGEIKAATGAAQPEEEAGVDETLKRMNWGKTA